jgi:hypothetical protein
MRDDAYAVRLRNANPVSAGDQPTVDEALLARLLAEPRTRTHRVPVWRAAVLFATAVILLGGTAAGVQRFVVEYFGADDSEPTPAAIMAELRRVAREDPDYFGSVDAERFVRLAAFDGSEGRVTVYIAAASRRDAYCVVEAVGTEFAGGACAPTTNPDKNIPYGASGSSAFGDAHVVYGRLTAGVASIDVRFQDGATRPASVRAPWWIHVARGEETEPGHAPAELIARDADGAIVARQRLNPYMFMSRGAIEGAIPAGDGSPEQNAIRTTLLRLGPLGAPIAQQVRLEETRLVRTVQTTRGSFRVYAAPWGDGGVCFGYFDKGLNFEHITSGCPSGDSRPEQGGAFDAGEIQAYRAGAGFAVVDGRPPVGSANVTFLFEDGTSASADIFTPSYFAFWFDADRLAPGRRPREIVARDARGRVIDRYELDPARLAP